MEKAIDTFSRDLPVLKNFIHPGGTIEASHLHFARAVSRRVERRYVAYSKINVNQCNEDNIKFFNRLSDFLFISARYMNRLNNVDDVISF